MAPTNTGRSFSWWAGVLTNGIVYSPLVRDKTGLQNIEFVNGNWPRMVDTSVNDRRAGEISEDLILPE